MTDTTAARLGLRRAQRRTGLEAAVRLRSVLAALGTPPRSAAGIDQLLADVVAALRDAPEDRVWLTLAVVSGRFPRSADVTRAVRTADLEGPAALLATAFDLTTQRSARRTVRLLTDRTVIDLGDLVTSPLGTGIQRVARNVTARWLADRDAAVVAWTRDGDAMRAVGSAELDGALQGRSVPAAAAEHDVVVVPWRCTYLLPELAVDPDRCAAMQAMAQSRANRTAVVGFDCVPITSPETAARGFANVFALNLAAVAHFDVVGAISQAAATEYEGWRRMLEGAGLTGPRIEAVGLPGEAPEADDEAMAEARARFLIPGMPMVLVVGSHEPRKNHLAVLHAAERAWRAGHRFSLSFVGGNAWGSEEFSEQLAALAAVGRPVESVSRLSDRVLWAAYRLARFTVFPSLNEGFGLPVAESLAAGTPALTSDFGSMREIAADGGALLVDPRDDEALSASFARLLTDDVLVARLTDEARRRPVRGWQDYADEMWALAHGES